MQSEQQEEWGQQEPMEQSVEGNMKRLLLTELDNLELLFGS